jgi:hypothetical protein
MGRTHVLNLETIGVKPGACTQNLLQWKLGRGYDSCLSDTGQTVLADARAILQ